MSVLEALEPKKVFYFFEELSGIPRGTFDMQRISEYCMEFARKRGLEASIDQADNVIIKKPGTPGYENAEPVILQGHLDMVCEKRPESNHDFTKDGIELVVEDGFVKAKDTTLGGDNGIAVAMAMAILDSSDIPHPPIEALFTTDEEVGMGGAMGADLSSLKGKMLINIDSEDEGILTAGCAGGYRFEAKIPIERTAKTGTIVEIKIHGLLGGHSGIEIEKQRGNAHKMMARLLNRIQRDIPILLAEINGGTKDNVISRESTAEILIQEEDLEKVEALTAEMKDIWMVEFMGDEPNLLVDINVQEQATADVCTKNSTQKVIFYMLVTPNGVQEYSRKLKGLVATSLNLGVVETAAETVKVVHLVRSSVESEKQQMKELLETCAQSVNSEIKIDSEYPAWMYRQESKLRQIMIDTYQELYGREPEVTTIHAGLECGLLIGIKPDLDCVSFGPDLFEVHSFNEKLDIESTNRSYEYLKAVLANCK